ncbi:alpha/beta hydrolase [Sabulicella rubraurantiaca]|uniref:alpha/beta hydrolase n=1 Tax=Sabulicella rubraurantiaca TaxID=2811429 RepID=UPI001A96AC38|nr:alpha/beta hydrolase [Sabulicella rubraurantiaca]
MPPRRTLLSLLALTGCSPTGVANLLTPAGGVSVQADIRYGPLPRQSLDLYSPEGLADTAPLLVFLYGGGWVSGSREDYAFVARPLARLGVMVAVPDYRLYPQVRFPDFVEDAALALRVLAARESQRPLVVMGHSAGGFIAASLAVDPRWGVRDMVRGFIGLAGPYDFGAEEASPPDIFAGTPRIAAAPASVDLRGAASMLLLHGAADRTVGPYHSRILAARAVAAGVPVRHREFPGMGHVGIIAAFAGPVRGLGLAQGNVLDEVASFLRGLPPLA